MEEGGRRGERREAEGEEFFLRNSNLEDFLYVATSSTAGLEVGCGSRCICTDVGWITETYGKPRVINHVKKLLTVPSLALLQPLSLYAVEQSSST